MKEQPPERDLDIQVGEELSRERPVPRAHFQSALGRRLVDLDPGHGPRPAKLWPLVGSYVLGGLLLILLALLLASGTL
jgi:hypothetical protein